MINECSRKIAQGKENYWEKKTRKRRGKIKGKSLSRKHAENKARRINKAEGRRKRRTA